MTTTQLIVIVGICAFLLVVIFASLRIYVKSSIETKIAEQPKQPVEEKAAANTPVEPSEPVKAEEPQKPETATAEFEKAVNNIKLDSPFGTVIPTEDGVIVCLYLKVSPEAFANKNIEIKTAPAPAEQPAPAPVKEEEPFLPAVEPVAEPEIAASEEEDEFANLKKNAKPRVPFAKRMLDAEKATKEYYNALNNELLSFRRIHGRVSQACASYRVGRGLVAKISLRGKTLKLHLALNVNDYNPNIYFQKDLKDVKAYEEVPFTVKIRSDRALKNALKLINEIGEKNEAKKIADYQAIDSIKALRDL